MARELSLKVYMIFDVAAMTILGMQVCNVHIRLQHQHHRHEAIPERMVSFMYISLQQVASAGALRSSFIAPPRPFRFSDTVAPDASADINA